MVNVWWFLLRLRSLTTFKRLWVPCPHHGFANLGQLGQRPHRPPPEVQNLGEGPGAETCLLSDTCPSHWIVSMYCCSLEYIWIYDNICYHMQSESSWILQSPRPWHGLWRHLTVPLAQFEAASLCNLIAAYAPGYNYNEFHPAISHVSRKYTKVDHCEIWPRSYFRACCTPFLNDDGQQLQFVVRCYWDGTGAIGFIRRNWQLLLQLLIPDLEDKADRRTLRHEQLDIRSGALE